MCFTIEIPKTLAIALCWDSVVNASRFFIRKKIAAEKGFLKRKVLDEIVLEPWSSSVRWLPKQSWFWPHMGHSACTPKSF